MGKIEDVGIMKLNSIHDERGFLYEIYRSDWEFFNEFGQLYLTATYKDAIKAWHLHEQQRDNICCISGMIKLVVLDLRKDSLYFGCHQEFFIGEDNLCLITIPPGVAHGWKCYKGEKALVVNCPDKLYNYSKPDEIRYAPNASFLVKEYTPTVNKPSGRADCYFSYNWDRKDG
jgi:dTDP-4-dehydrorhamnose 3,5-epimerase